MKRSKFSLSHFKLLTCKMGSLIPVGWFEALPGDTIQQATSALIRCAPLVTPPMHPVTVRFHHWFVPNRLLWSEWEKFITGGPDGTFTAVAPYVDFTGARPAVSTLADYLGCPTSGSGYVASALPFRAYAKIWNEFYRDQDLQTELTVSTASGADSTTNAALQQCDWEKDYLTSARPWAQKGAAVTLPLGASAPISGIGLLDGVTASATSGIARNTTAAYDLPAGSPAVSSATPAGIVVKTQATGAISGSNRPQIFADLSGATSVDINTVRHAFALQRFEEARARYGSRYTEYLRYLGVRSSDARLQRPEYLGGGKNTIQFSEVLQTGPGTDPVATMKGHGITAMRTNRYRRFFEEHGIVMTLMSVRPKTMYSQRLARKFIRGFGVSGTTGTKEDYWQRELQHIGQQQINGQEVDASNSAASTFGYQDRYDEYRREESGVAGLFRTTLNTWHLSREFASPPSLNSTFVSCVPSTRIFADLTADNLYVMANHSIQARRLVAREGTSMTF